MKYKKVYIAGKVTGEDREQCAEKFARWEAVLQAKNYRTVNPMHLVGEDVEWDKAMRVCIAELMKCDLILLLPDWMYSAGATIELELAASMGINVLPRGFVDDNYRPSLDICRIRKIMTEYGRLNDEDIV